METQFNIEQVFSYVEGWLMSDADMENLSINEIKAMLHNSLAMLEDYQDGIEYYVERTFNK
jgi:hypothetical protein